MTEIVASDNISPSIIEVGISATSGYSFLKKIKIVLISTPLHISCSRFIQPLKMVLIITFLLVSPVHLFDAFYAHYKLLFQNNI